jgi:hypothetical protein
VRGVVGDVGDVPLFFGIVAGAVAGGTVGTRGGREAGADFVESSGSNVGTFSGAIAQ